MIMMMDLRRQLGAIRRACRQWLGECIPYLIVRHGRDFAHTVSIEQLGRACLEYSKPRTRLPDVRRLGLLLRWHTLALAHIIEVDTHTLREGHGIPNLGRPADNKVAHSSGHAATIHILSKLRPEIMVQELMMAMMTLRPMSLSGGTSDRCAYTSVCFPPGCACIACFDMDA